MKDWKTVLKLWLLCLGTFGGSLLAQPVLWQRVVGGNMQDHIYAYENDGFGSYVMGGFTRSNNVEGLNKSGLDADAWAFKMNSRGGMIWQNHYGGSGNEEVYAMRQTPDGGYLLVGFSDSKEFAKGGRDFYILRIDALGAKRWEKSFGGSGRDIARAIALTPDGGFLVVGETNSPDAFDKRLYGGTDGWAIRLDANGKKLWDVNLGGNLNDVLMGVAYVPGGWVVLGSTESTDVPNAPAKGKTDYLLSRIDDNGKILWYKTMGGSANDLPHSLVNTQDGNLVMAGTTFSMDGDVKNNKGEGDVWVCKLDYNGTLLWERTFGGTSDEGANGISQLYNGTFLVAAMTRSSDGDVSSHRGLYDAWLLKLNTNGKLLWQKSMGGDGVDVFHQGHDIPSGDYVAVGVSASNDGDLAAQDTRGGEDAWVVCVRDPIEPSQYKGPSTPTIITGYIRDKNTKKYVEAEVTLVNNTTGFKAKPVKSDTSFGIYQLLTADTVMMSIGVMKKGYMFISKTINVDPKQRYSEIRLDLELEPIKVGASINLYDIYFDPGKWDVKDESKPELDRVVEFMLANPTVKIELGGHTDDTGDPTRKIELSLNRANGVKARLTSMGVAASRIYTRGYGMTKPVADNEDEEGRALNRRVEFKITGQ